MFDSFCRSSYRTFSLVSLLVVLAVPAGAQQLFWVHREAAMPSKVAEYEKTNKEFIDMVKANRDVMPKFNFEAWMSPDFVYTMVTPIGESLGGGDVFLKEFADVAAKTPPNVADVWHRNGSTISWWSDIIYVLRSDLSYGPPTQRLQPEEGKFAQMDFYYLQPGFAPDAEAVAAEMKALYEKKKIPNPYIVLQAVTGEGPVYIVRTLAKDPADYWVNRQKDLEMLGPEGTALFSRVFAFTRKFESLQFFRRPDLSLAPPAKN